MLECRHICWSDMPKSLGDDGIKLCLSLQLSDAKAVVLVFMGAKSQRAARRNGSLLLSVMTVLKAGNE